LVVRCLSSLRTAKARRSLSGASKKTVRSAAGAASDQAAESLRGAYQRAALRALFRGASFDELRASFGMPA
jgi:hypothetical protein